MKSIRCPHCRTFIPRLRLQFLRETERPLCCVACSIEQRTVAEVSTAAVMDRDRDAAAILRHSLREAVQ